jgi:16S rRNA (guanine1516-N2)-methyltransferase
VTPKVAVRCLEDGDPDAARELGSRLDLPVIPAHAATCEFDLVLELSAAGAALASGTDPRLQPLRCDFGDARMRHRRRAGHNELLGRAVGVRGDRRPQVIDATAGLGRDAFVLADLGCEVTLCERQPLVQALLGDAHARALASDDPWLSAVAGRMHLHLGAAETLPHNQLAGAAVLYLDPMFPDDRRRAAPGKGMQLLQRLYAAADLQEEGERLARWALDTPVERLVVKRPLRAGPLLEPVTHSLRGRAVRFDVTVRTPRQGD